MAASTLFVHAAPPKEGFVSASFNSHCVAFLSLHINVLFITKVSQVNKYQLACL